MTDSNALSESGLECPHNGNLLEHQSTKVQKLKQKGSILRFHASQTPFSTTLIPNNKDKLVHFQGRQGMTALSNTPAQRLHTTLFPNCKIATPISSSMRKKNKN